MLNNIQKKESTFLLQPLTSDSSADDVSAEFSCLAVPLPFTAVERPRADTPPPAVRAEDGRLMTGFPTAGDGWDWLRRMARLNAAGFRPLPLPLLPA